MTTTTTIRHQTSPQSEHMIFSFLKNHPEGTLTTINKEYILQTSVVNVYNLDDHLLAFMTKRSTRKYKNLQQNPTISFMTYDALSRTELEIEGIAQPIIESDQQEEILKVIRLDEKKGRRHISPFVNEADDDYALFIIYPRKIHMTTFWAEEIGNGIFQEAIEYDINMTS